MSSKKFQVIVYDKSRKYHFTGTALRCSLLHSLSCLTMCLSHTDPLGAERWTTAIGFFTAAQREYLKNTLSSTK